MGAVFCFMNGKGMLNEKYCTGLAEGNGGVIDQRWRSGLSHRRV